MLTRQLHARRHGSLSGRVVQRQQAWRQALLLEVCGDRELPAAAGCQHGLSGLDIDVAEGRYLLVSTCQTQPEGACEKGGPGARAGHMC